VDADTLLEPEASPDMGATPGAGDVVRRLVEACHDPAEDVWDDLDARMRATVLTALSDVRERHAALLAECGLPEDPPQGAEDRRTAMVAYRHWLTSDVFPALAMVLDRHEPTSMVVDCFGRGFATALEGARGLPETMLAQWGEGALDPRPTDPWGRRARKALGRWVSVARKADRERSVPVRALALRHLGLHVLPGYDRSASDAVRAWAEWAGRLERACAAWADVALPILGRAEVVEVPAADPEEAPSEPADEAWIALQVAAEAFDATLNALMEQPHTEARLTCEELMGRARGALDSDARVAGSFVFRPEAPMIGAHPLPELQRARLKLAGWDRQVASRISLYRTLLAVMVGGAAVRDRMRVRLEAVTLEPSATLLDCAEALTALAAEAKRRGTGDGAPETFDDLRLDGDRLVARALAAFPDPDRVSLEVESVVGDTVDALQAIVRQTPGTLVLHRLDSRTPTNLRAADTREVAFQELARQSLDALRIERIRSAALGFGSALVPVRANLAELPDVIQFAFDASSKELSVADADGAASERAALLAAEALERSAGVLRRAPARVGSALEAAQRQVASELADGGLALLERVGAGRVQSQLLMARSRFWDGLVRLDARFGPALDRARRRARLLSLRSGRSTRRTLRRVRALLGDDSGAPATQSTRTVRAFARADSGPGHVPLVYQRLFSFDPVTDPAFLVGRTGELADVAQRWRRWREDDEVPVMVRGYPGSGVTSFLRIATDVLRADGASVVRFDVEERIASEAELVSRLASLLDLPPAATLGAFARTIVRAAPGTDLPDVVAFDGFEHLYLRVPGGTDVLERFLTFMSETEPRIFWLAGVSQPAWQLLAKAEPTAVSQVDDFELRALPVDRLRETIMQRHRRSGLRLRFAEPREGRALLKRRLRRLRGTDAHQRVLEADFFEQLHRVSLGNIKLALFHWLLAADFEREDGEVLMQPLRRPDFGALDALDAAQNFTLKALLEHRTLTLDEHHAVFRVTRQESYQTFESLQNRRLIEPVDGASSAERQDSEINRGIRYRIRPLLVGAVTGHLRTLNIVH